MLKVPANVCTYECIGMTFSRGGSNWYGCPSCLWSAEEGKYVFLSSPAFENLCEKVNVHPTPGTVDSSFAQVMESTVMSGTRG